MLGPPRAAGNAPFTPPIPWLMLKRGTWIYNGFVIRVETRISNFPTKTKDCKSPFRVSMVFVANGTHGRVVALATACSLDFFFPQQQNALGSSAIVKVSEQTGAAPKPIPPRFPGSK